MGIAEADLKVGDRVVYPNQGVCRVVGTTEMNIGGQHETFIKLQREDDEGTVMVPKGRIAHVGVRLVADTGDLKKVFDYLAAPVEGPELDWKVRARSHGERMSEGGLMGLAQVVKGLATLADLRPLPPKERELYDNARHLLINEIAAAASLPDVSAEDAVDLVLFPPGVERKKPELKEPLGDEAGLAEGVDLGEAVLEEIGEEAAPVESEEAEEAEEQEVPEEAEEETAQKAPPKGGRPTATAGAKPKAKPAEKKKPAVKKAAAKPAAKKAAPKPAAKKAAPKPAPKKAAPKPAPKKATAKPAAKKPAAKVTAKTKK